MFITKEKFDEMVANNIGVCAECGELIEDVLPEETNMRCPECGENEAFGVKKAVASGILEID